MEFIINYDSKVPLYFQLKEQIRKNILSGGYKEGDLIPSERELGDQYDLSSTTIRRALNDLVQENFLERKAGKGTFVRLNKVKRDLRKVIGFTKNMQEMGLIPSTRVISKKLVAANAYARSRLSLDKGAQIVRLERVRMASDIPMMFETRYIRTDICPGIEMKELDSSLWKVFEEKYGLKPNRHSQNMNITVVTGRSAYLLTLKEGTHVFLIKGVTYVQDNLPIECEESLYRTDKYELAFEAIID
jgi:GntR family transcriptional regulator